MSSDSTLDAKFKQAFDSLQLQYERKNSMGAIVEQFSAPASFCWIDVALFPQQVGFLVIKLQLEEANPTVDRLNDFLYYLRSVQREDLELLSPYWTSHIKRFGDYVLDWEELPPPLE